MPEAAREMASRSQYPCPECRVGNLIADRVSYFSWSGGLFLTVPDFPAWKCDICGWYAYDRVALAELQLLLRWPERPAADRAAGRNVELPAS